MEQNKSSRDVGAFLRECKNVGTEAYKPATRQKSDYLWKGDNDEVTKRARAVMEASSRVVAGSPPSQARAMTW